MSTPMPPKLKSEVLSLDASRRGRRHGPDESTDPPPWARRHAQDEEQPEAGEPEERTPVGPGSVRMAHERLDDSIKQAIETACLDDEAEAGKDEAAEADGGWPSLPPASSLQTPADGAADRLSTGADARRFDNDLAQTQARRRRSLEPEVVPEPPRDTEFRLAPLLLRFVVVVSFAALAAYAVTMVGPLYTRFLSSARTADNAVETVPIDATENAPVAETAPVAEDRSAASEKSARLVVQNRQSFTNQPAELGISVDGGAGNESLLLSGLIAGTRLSAGAPLGDTRWELALKDLPNVYVYAPKDFVGVMNAVVDLLSPEAQLLDTKPVQFAWIAKAVEPPVSEIEPEQQAAPSQPQDPAQEAMMLKRGEDLLNIGDIAGARRVFQYLADAGSADGALAMGATFDARFLAAHDAIGVAADDAKALTWYRRAADLGSTQAKSLLAQMTDQ
jgi:hypothetical protein